jgi:hypothetical protein
MFDQRRRPRLGGGAGRGRGTKAETEQILPQPAPYTAILALARTGAASRAWTAFMGAGLGDITDDPKVLTLKARLLKDQARRAEGEAQARLFLRSAQAYADAAALTPDSYPLINAATMSLFAGQTDHMELLARQVLMLLQTGVGGGETPYWHQATQAEAELLLGHIGHAQSGLAKAIFHAPKAWEDHATTLRQFRQILRFREQSDDWLQQFAPPPSMYFGGMIGIAADDEKAKRDITEMVQSSKAAFGYGALAAGADILIAEALLAAGGELHVILPSIPSTFKRLSVEPYGPEWSARFDVLFETATSVDILDGGSVLSRAAIDVAALVAKGCAVDHAERLESDALEMRVIEQGRQPANVTALILELPRTATAMPASDMKAAHAVMLIAAEGNDVTTCLARADLTTVDNITHLAEFSDVAMAADALRQLRAALGHATIAVNLVLVDGSEPVNDRHRARLLRMLNATTKGTTIAGKEATMALKALDPGMWVEPVGELPDAASAIAIYVIALAANGNRLLPIVEP